MLLRCISMDDPIWTRWGCKVQGGGNAGNALTCAAHLGLNSRLISKNEKKRKYFTSCDKTIRGFLAGETMLAAGRLVAETT
ncbi:hypothetical protein MKW98_000760 [Papaver atlanticum]|uniref:Carbohydrate kinase PfkB domain-containing protein n=1 Tax=Papaver atlanticum TaxID=357466 RepID=A0AAD4SCG1_9MAGN|nr:hypothetical protein MKW98_000760 [Papaver atlanticum]